MWIRRPLLWAALCLVLAAAAGLKAGVFDSVPPGQISLRSLENRERLTLAGQVYRKDSGQIYLKEVIILRQISETNLSDQYLISQAGDSRQSISCKENILCRLGETESIPLGSVIALEGIFSPFSGATNPGEFDTAAYYQTQGVGGRLEAAAVLSQGEKYWPLRQALYDLGVLLRERLYRALPEQEAGIMCALLLGDKEGLDDQVKELYQRNGILHILSISALHVSILGMTLYHLLRRLGVPVAPAAAAGSILLVLYGGLTGFGVSACRAIGMYLIRMLGEAVGRTYDMLTALGVMAAVMVAGNPYYLHHSGFLLSYSSVLGISVLCPALFRRSKHDSGAERHSAQRIKQWVSGHRGRELLMQGAERLTGGLGQSAAASLSVTLATLPVQLWFYYEVPVYAVFLNLLVIPLVEPLMLSGFAAMVTPGFPPACFGVGLILRFYEFLCECFGSLPFHTWNPGCPKLWQIGIYYLLLTAAAAVKTRLNHREGKAGGVPREIFRRLSETISKEDLHKLRAMLLWISIACAVIVLGVRPSAENQAVFLDVGQGDCILIRTASGENYLFDCGSQNRSGVGEYVLVPYLKYHGIHRLDAVFVSHPDKDHMSGILELLKMGEEVGVKVCRLVLPGIAEELREEQLGQLVTAARDSGQSEPVEIRWLAAGDSWQAGSADFLCLHPESGSTLADSNAYSECVYVEFRESGGKWSLPQSAGALLLTGDVEGEGEKALLEALKRYGIEQVDVLKVAHHGSRGTTSRELLSQTNPCLSVISSGRNNSYGHPHEELLKRLEDAGSMILGTAGRGAVTLHFHKGEILVETFLRP